MGYYTTAEIVKIVNKLIDRCGTRDPYKVAKELGINIIYRDFEKQRGAYKVHAVGEGSVPIEENYWFHGGFGSP